jgi:hypothetical protein
MRRMILCVVLLVAVPLGAQQLDPAAVAAAIKAGQDNKLKPLISDCQAGPSLGQAMGSALRLEDGVKLDGYYHVVVSRAAGRIGYMASEAKRLYQPFSADDIPESITANTLVYVTATPRKPVPDGKSISVAAPIEQLVLKSKAQSTAVARPDNLDITPTQWPTPSGGTVAGTAAVATFPLSAIREFPAGDFDVVLVTTAGERRCKVGQADRVKLFR